MKNRNFTENELYALERSARRERAKEIARLVAAAYGRIAGLFQVSHASHVSSDRKVAVHA